MAREELLVRMLDDNDDVIPPSSFLPTAERLGLITEIDRLVLGEGDRAGRALAADRGQRLRRLALATRG